MKCINAEAERTGYMDTREVKSLKGMRGRSNDSEAGCMAGEKIAKQVVSVIFHHKLDIKCLSINIRAFLLLREWQSQIWGMPERGIISNKSCSYEVSKPIQNLFAKMS